MLNLFADALLVAMRMEPLGTHPSAYRHSPEAEPRTKARWFALSGLRR